MNRDSHHAAETRSHPFVARPHRTVLAMSVPVFASLVAEPVTGIVDTAFVKELGATASAALGVGTILISSVLWVFNFLAIGTQTEVARSHGAGSGGARIAWLALLLSALGGSALAVTGTLGAGPVADLMGARDEIHTAAVTYLRIRLAGAPAILLTATAFGALRGRQNMTTPLWIAVAVNALNCGLDAVLILGAGPIPACGIAGAAWATVTSQWLGALWALRAVRRRLGPPARLRLADARQLFVVGADLFLRTGLLLLFLAWTTRAATELGGTAGAAHQAIRQVWLLTALALDAFAATAQSLIGHFAGADATALARRAAAVSATHALTAGVALTALMLAGTDAVAWLLVPTGARETFRLAWYACAAFQPLNALSFVTDGIHWATRDYRYLRNAMLLATGTGIAALESLQHAGAVSLVGLWLLTGGWIAIRATAGVARIWPGIGRAPLALRSGPPPG